jgi:uncharacterized protein YdhG (YjbR/CyaY superfamily)
MTTPKPTTLDAYIAGFPEETQTRLQQIRAVIRQVAPEAEETISYAIPCFKRHGTFLVYFAGYPRHIGLYPIPTDHPALAAEVAGYMTSGKGAIQFPHHQPLPLALIARIVEVMVEQNEARAKGKQLSRK